MSSIALPPLQAHDATMAKSKPRQRSKDVIFFTAGRTAKYKLRAAAKADGRTLSQLVSNICHEWLDRNLGQPEETAP